MPRSTTPQGVTNYVREVLALERTSDEVATAFNLVECVTRFLQISLAQMLLKNGFIRDGLNLFFHSFGHRHFVLERVPSLRMRYFRV